MNSGSFLAELKRRNVYKVAVAYIVAGWALSQGIAQVFPVFDVPNWIVRLIVAFIVVGFPIALVFAWAFEITPEGVKSTAEADAMLPSARPSNRSRWRCSSWVATRPQTEQHCRATRNRSPFCRSLA
jgi:hypothetical protein